MTREVGHLLAFANSGERKDAHSRGPLAGLLWLVINKDASNPDEKYWLSAAVDLAILAAIIFFFIWAEKSLRRARKQRRSAEEPDELESGARSPQ